MNNLNNQCCNPFLPSWEYIPDGEPRVFGERVYLFGSHDRAHGFVYCQNDYVCWSAPVDNLAEWRYEGIIYKKTTDPLNTDGKMTLYAPDVVQGPDGKYYMYYVLDTARLLSVARCDTPAGEYQFYDYVHYQDGTRLGSKEGDEPPFDPGVYVEGEKVYLYSGLGVLNDATRKGAFAMVLDKDMVTIVEAPEIIVPSLAHGRDTDFRGHEFFEAASMRKIDRKYYFIYSSVHMTELCYAISSYPTKGFVYGGVLVSNSDLNISEYKPANKRTYPTGNNHGSILQIGKQWYIFYHRMTNGTWFSRQACAEPITIQSNGRIKQVEITSQGMNGKPLQGMGTYPAYICCNLYNDVQAFNSDGKKAKITQDGRDAEPTEIPNQEDAYITDIIDGTVIGYKYFNLQGVKKITLRTRAYCRGEFQIRTSPEGGVLGTVPVTSSNVWTDFSANVRILDGVQPLYFTYKGSGTPHLLSFTLEG